MVRGVYRYDKKNKESKLLPFDHVASIKDFYTLEALGGKKDTTLENPFFSTIDGKFNSIIEHITSRKPLTVIHSALVEIISSSYARVPKQRKNFDRIANEVFKLIMPSFIDSFLKNYNETIEKYQKDTGNIINEKQKEWIRKNLSIEKFKPSTGHALYTMLATMDVHSRVTSKGSFWIGLAPEGTSFILSDNPAANTYLPLTPSMCLFTSHEKVENEYVPLPAEAVETINLWTEREAEQYIFSDKKLLF